jgi:hypothetical protein
MESSSAETILNRIFDTAADNLRIAKILVQIGLDPNNITTTHYSTGCWKLCWPTSRLPTCMP